MDLLCGVVRTEAQNAKFLGSKQDMERTGFLAHMPCHGVQVLIRQKNGRRRRSACKKGKKEENNKKKEILYEKRLR